MNLLQQNLDRYIDDDVFLRLLGEHDICVLSDFILAKTNEIGETVNGDSELPIETTL